MFEELKKRLEAQYSDQWFVEHGATDDGLSRVDDGTSSMEGLFPFYGEVPDMEFVVMMRNELPAIFERLDELEKVIADYDPWTLCGSYEEGCHQGCNDCSCAPFVELKQKSKTT